MFRHSLLPCTCFGVALGIAAALPIPAHSQDRSTYDRLDRLERDLNMLQRQVYRGGPAPVPGGDPGVAMNAELRIDRIETQMRELTRRASLAPDRSLPRRRHQPPVPCRAARPASSTIMPSASSSRPITPPRKRP